MDTEPGEDAGDLETLTAAIAADARDEPPRFQRGMLHHGAGRLEEALADFDVAHELDPTDATTLRWRAMTWLDLSERDDESEVFVFQALADLDRVVALEPELADAFEERGRALVQAHCAAEAIEDFRAALSRGATPVELGIWLASAALQAGRPEEAVAAVDAAIAAGDNSACVHWWRGRALKKAGDLEAARLALDEAVRLDPKDPRKYAERATVWTKLGEPERAALDLSRAIELAPAEADHHLDRAEARSALGDERRADEDFGRGVLLRAGGPSRSDSVAKRKLVYLLLRDHFGEHAFEDLTVHERRFPRRVRADVQHALDALPESRFKTLGFSGLASEHDHVALGFAQLTKRNRYATVVVSAPQYEDVDVGTDQAVRCIVSGLWLLDVDGTHVALLPLPPNRSGGGGLQFQVAVPEGASAIADELFGLFESAVSEARCYRGKVLSLEVCRTDYAGRSTGIAVHRLPAITRDDVILPEATLDLLARNVFDFIERRPRLRELRMSTKKGLLFYGPPGTGKTHTIRYLATTLVGQTTLLITANQMALLSEYMLLARLLQPSIVVIEDVDLIARDRQRHEGPGTESLLNQLLNEMDGLQPEADVLFILTTNRPETLEPALASRPGRIDQAIEFPRPDETCRRRLAELYSGGLELSESTTGTVVARSEGASASFIRELMRRSAQFMLERGADRAVEPDDVEAAIREMVEVGGSLNRTLLGG